jgi:predicted acylesterase/phospholipase RssA
MAAPTNPSAAAPEQAGSPPRHRSRFKRNREAKTALNRARADHQARTALVLGGGAPNMALMAGALAAFEDHGIVFDVVSTSGAGSLAGLLWLAPKGQTPTQALNSVVTMSVSDEIYRGFPVNYKVFHKPGTWADWWRNALAANPAFALDPQRYEHSPPYALWADWMALWAATLSPTDLAWSSWGLCAPVPFIEHLIDFDKLARIKPHFYLNAYNITNEQIDDFSKHEITPDHFRAALAFPFIYGPYRLKQNDCLYYEGAVVDCLNFKDLVERHPDLETIVVFDVLGSDKLIRAPRDIYDSWVLSMIIPLVETAENDLELFALKYNKGVSRECGAKSDVLKIDFDIPEEHLPEVLDWTASNARRLFDIGRASGERFCKAHASKLKARAPS